MFIFVVGLSYVYFLNIVVLETAMREENLDKLKQTKRKVQNLEMSYIDKISKLSIPYAESLGFVESEAYDYVYIQRPMAKAR